MGRYAFVGLGVEAGVRRGGGSSGVLGSDRRRV